MRQRILSYVILLCILFVASPVKAVSHVYAEVIAGCTHLAGNCANVRLGPGTSYAVAKKARIGTVLEVDGQVVSDGILWYRVKKDSFIRYPERALGTWYIAAYLVSLSEERGVETAKKPAHNGKYILVDISSQMLYAYTVVGTEHHLALSARVSTGIKKTPTPKGAFYIYKKQPSRYMQGPLPGVSEKEYDLPGVPWTMYFTQGGAAIHGTYWHSAFGTPHSNGCVNLPVTTAKVLYDWADVGTRVYVRL